MSALASTEQKSKKGYVQYKEIAHFRLGIKNTEKGKAFSRSYTLLTFEKEDGITFSLRARNGSEFSTQYLYKLRLRRNKKGEARFVFYKVRVDGMGDRGVRTVNPNHFRSQMASICHKFEGNRKRPILPYEERNKGLYKAQAQRMRSVILAFLKKHNVPVKGLSKDPFSMMVQLCYPGTLYFKEETLRDISTGSFLLDDPVKLAMRTKGKLSRKLVYQAIEKFPKSTQTLLKFARYVRVNRSLDDAQRFIQTIVNYEGWTSEFGGIDLNYAAHPIKAAPAKQLRVLDRIPTEQLARDLAQSREVCDTFNMLSALNQDNGEGFNVGELQYRSIRELHDAIIDTTHFSRGRRRGFTDYEFDPDSAPMKFCQILLDNFKDDEWKVYFAKNTVELRNHSEKFHNCSFGYHGRIKSGNYAIFCLDSLTSNERYMFGVSFRWKWHGKDRSLPPKGVAMLSEVQSPCNKGIDANRHNELCQKIQKAVPNFEFASRCTLSAQPVLH